MREIQRMLRNGMEITEISIGGHDFSVKKFLAFINGGVSFLNESQDNLSMDELTYAATDFIEDANLNLNEKSEELLRLLGFHFFKDYMSSRPMNDA